MRLRNLIAIATLTSYCAAPLKEIHINEPLEISASAPTAIEGIREIDPENPPYEGVWMPWPDAIDFARHLRDERVANETKIVLITKDLDIANYKLKQDEKQLEGAPVRQWWLTWGFPLGLTFGVIVGVIVPLSIGFHK